ncbi:lactonase family protein [Pseudoneobacillus sp. C159]
MSHYTGYIGTYTKEGSQGIYTFILDIETQKIIDINVAAELGNPTYVSIDQKNQILYSVIKEGESGGVAAYSIHNQTNELFLLNSQVTEGAPPCHVTVNQDNQYIVSANYHKGMIELFELKNGAILEKLSSAVHHGSGPNKDRQEKPHAHYAGFTPDEKYVVAIDLGTDQLITYVINNRELKKITSLTFKPGSGPRHLVFHPNGKFAYVMTELSSEVVTLAYNKENGHFSEIQYITTIPTEYNGNNQGSAIHITSDGRFVYVSNRGHNSIASFRVNEVSGELTFIEFTSSEGDWPRDFSLDPTEKFLIVANQESGNLVLFSRDGETGRLTLLQSNSKVPQPVCVKFLNNFTIMKE